MKQKAQLSVIGSGLPESRQEQQDQERMARALEVAAATPAGDVPVGAVVYAPDGAELAAATNRREIDADPTAHAEVLALRVAAARLGDAWRLEDCSLVVTLEPCAMCAGAAIGARIGTVVFGAWEPKTGACGSVFDVARESPLHTAEVRGGVCVDQCEELLREFFRSRR